MIRDNDSILNPEKPIVFDTSKVNDGVAKSTKEAQQREKDARLIRTTNEMTDVNIFAFLLAMFMGDADDETISKISNALGLGDDFRQTLQDFRSGEITAFTAASRTYGSIDTKNVDWSEAISIINGDTYQSFIEHLKLREGYENKVYTDSRGHLTVGVGHLVKPEDGLRAGDIISDDRVMEFLERDSISAYNRATLQAQELGMNDKEFIAGLASVNFQLGSNWNKEHKKTWALMKQGDFKAAITEAADSNWNDQTPKRVQDFQKILSRASQIKDGTITAQAPENAHTASLRLDSSLEASLSNKILRISETDNAYGGYCAKGVGNIFENLGVDITRGNAHTWIDSLPKNGWIKLENVDPQHAPIGSAIVYDRNTNYSGGGGGAEYGHIETPVIGDHGQKMYVSDKARSNWGGTVPQNFAGVFIHPDIHKDIIATLTEAKESQKLAKSTLHEQFAQGGIEVKDPKQPAPLTTAFEENKDTGVDQVAKAAEEAEKVADLNNDILGQKPTTTMTQQI